jgi:hypothetical protein
MRALNWPLRRGLPILVSYQALAANYFNFEENIMTTITSKQAVRPEATPFSLMFILETIFAVHLRESLDKDTKGDKSDAAYTYGL